MQENKPFPGDESASWLINRATVSSSLRPVRTTLAGRLAKGLSMVFHPLLVPAYLFAILFWVSPAMMGVSNADIRIRIFLLLLVATFAIPIISIYMLYRLGSISSLDMDQKQDRLFPMVSTTLFYALTTWLFIKQLSVLYMVMIMLGATTCCLAVLTLVSVFWKISAHSVSISGLAGFLLALYYKNDTAELLYPMLGIIVVAGLLMSARLYLQVHTFAQVCAGACLGFGISIGTIWLFT